MSSPVETSLFPSSPDSRCRCQRPTVCACVLLIVPARNGGAGVATQDTADSGIRDCPEKEIARRLDGEQPGAISVTANAKLHRHGRRVEHRRGIGIRRRERHDERADRERPTAGRPRPPGRQPSQRQQQHPAGHFPDADTCRHALSCHLRETPACRRATQSRCRSDASTSSRSESSACRSARPNPSSARRAAARCGSRFHWRTQGPTTDHVTSDAGSTVTPDRRSSVDCTVSVTCELGWTRPRTVDIQVRRGRSRRAASSSGPRPGRSARRGERDARLNREVDQRGARFLAGRRSRPRRGAMTADVTNPVCIQESEGRRTPMRHRTETPALAFLVIG